LRPLNNVAAAAVAIEIAPPAGKISDLDSPAYQQAVAESVVAGIEAVKDRLGSGAEVTSSDVTRPDLTKAGVTR
jgi:hypothetical protein